MKGDDDKEDLRGQIIPVYRNIRLGRVQALVGILHAIVWRELADKVPELLVQELDILESCWLVQFLKVMRNLSDNLCKPLAQNDESRRGGFGERFGNDRLARLDICEFNVARVLCIAICISDGWRSSEDERVARGLSATNCEKARLLTCGLHGRDKTTLGDGIP
jgi:hypothetical protein